MLKREDLDLALCSVVLREVDVFMSLFSFLIASFASHLPKAGKQI